MYGLVLDVSQKFDFKVPTRIPIIEHNEAYMTAVIGQDGLQLKTFPSAIVAINGNYFLSINIKFEVHFSYQVDIGFPCSSIHAKQ